MLVDEIIEILSDESRPVTGALLKTKVLLHSIGKPDLVPWVNHELNGYPDVDSVPAYRKVRGEIRGNLANIAMRYRNHPIPVGHLDEDGLNALQKICFREPIATLQEFSDADSTAVKKPIPMEFNALLGKQLDGFHVEAAWLQLSTAVITGIIGQVRSRLLDFVLELKGSVGDSATDSELKERAKAVDVAAMFNGAVFGPNTTIIVGHGNQQNVQINNQKGDAVGLAEKLRQVGVPEDEIKALTIAIKSDEKEGIAPSFEGRAGHWYSGLLGKAARGAVSVGTDVVTGVVTKLLSAYFGLG